MKKGQSFDTACSYLKALQNNLLQSKWSQNTTTKRLSSLKSIPLAHDVQIVLNMIHNVPLIHRMSLGTPICQIPQLGILHLQSGIITSFSCLTDKLVSSVFPSFQQSNHHPSPRTAVELSSQLHIHPSPLLPRRKISKRRISCPQKVGNRVLPDHFSETFEDAG
jgi:hypothetical protein